MAEKKKHLIGRTIVQRVRFKTLYISYPSHAKETRYHQNYLNFVWSDNGNPDRGQSI